MGQGFCKLWAKFECRVLLLGLDAAGKTTILYRMKLGEVVTTIPTIGFNVETIHHKKISFVAWDVGGRDKIRPLYRHYFQNTDAVIYVVDSNDVERLDDAKQELHSFLHEDELKDVILLVLANKQDLPSARSSLHVSESLELHKVKQHWYIIPTVAPTGDGLQEALDWLQEMLSARRRGVSDSALTFMKKPDSPSPTSYLGKTWKLLQTLFVAQ